MPFIGIHICPSCGQKNNAVKSAEGDEKALPSPGDVSVCFFCAAVNIFERELTLRPMTKAEWVHTHPDDRNLIRKARAHLGKGADPQFPK